MKLTKYDHACFTVEKDGQALVVDPGNFSGDFIAPSGVVGIVITHQHPDHFDHEQLAAIVDKNPDATIVAPQAVCDKIEVFKTQSVAPGTAITVGNFSLEFYGGEHAVIHPGLPTIQNIGVMINDLLYYPGDSFASPGRAVDTLALPVSAPWMKLSEAMDFLVMMKPRLAFPTHDAILSDAGHSLVDRMLLETAQSQKITYQRLTDPIDI